MMVLILTVGQHTLKHTVSAGTVSKYFIPLDIDFCLAGFFGLFFVVLGI